MITFSKWSGSGNDFILIEDWDETFPSNQPLLIQKLCQRQTGIGADGLLLMSRSRDDGLKMRYFNADGFEVAMCGNGIRCFFRHALSEGYCTSPTVIHTQKSRYLCQEKNNLISVEMGIPEVIEWECLEGYWINTGVPHLILPVEDVDLIDVGKEGKKHRFDPKFSPEGVNVNFVSRHQPGFLKIRTFERGVEGETLACGTGVVAAAFVAKKAWGLPSNIQVETRLKTMLSVSIGEDDQCELIGPAEKIFMGSFEIQNFF